MTILKKKRVALMVMAILLAGCSDGEDGVMERQANREPPENLGSRGRILQ